MPRKRSDLNKDAKLTNYTVYTAREEVDKDFGDIDIYTAPWDAIGDGWKRYFENHHVTYAEHDISEEKNAKKNLDLLASIGVSDPLVPTIVINGVVLSRPNRADIDKELSIEDTQARELYDVVVVGGGISGYAAAYHCAHNRLKTVLIDRKDTLSRIESLAWVQNFLTYPEGIEGKELAWRMREELEQNSDTILVSGVMAKRLKRVGNLFEISTDGAIYRTKSVVLAIGAVHARFGVSGEQEFSYRGIHYDARTEYPLARGRDVTIIGTGDELFDDALLLAQVASQVSVMHVGKERMPDAFVLQRFSELGIQYSPSVRISEFRGHVNLDGIKYFDLIKQRAYVRDAHLCFVTLPNTFETRWLAPVLDLAKDGMILRSSELRSSWDGVFVAGDCGSSRELSLNASYEEGVLATVKVLEYLSVWTDRFVKRR